MISVILYCLTSGFVKKYIIQNKAIRVTCAMLNLLKSLRFEYIGIKG